MSLLKEENSGIEQLTISLGSAPGVLSKRNIEGRRQRCLMVEKRRGEKEWARR